MRIVKISLSIVFCLLVSSNGKAVQQGSDTLISIQPFFSFPNTDSDNTLLTFGFFRSGFGLQDRTTTCTFKSIFPISGPIDLNGGQLYLANDLVMQNPASLNSSGIVLGNNYNIDFSSSVTGIPATYNMVFQNSNIFLDSDLTISGTVKFTGNCLLDGHWNRVTLATGSNIVVGRNSRLCLRNIEVEGIAGHNIQCLDDGGSIILDNMVWDQEANFTFSNGSLKFVNNVVFSGPWTFNYTSNLTSTIDMNSTWFLSDLTKLSIGRQGSVYGRNPIYFTDITSILEMKNSTLNVNPNGLSITRGTFLIDGEVKFDINSTGSTNGLIFGDGNIADDMKLKFTPASVANLVYGDLVHNVVSLGNFVSDDVQKIFIRQGVGANYWSNFDSYFVNVYLEFAEGGINFLAPGKHGYFNGCTAIINNALDFSLTATFINNFTFGLNNGGVIAVNAGSFIAPLGVVAYGVGNIFTSPSDVSGFLTLNNNTSQLLLGIGGSLLSNITMNGGNVTLLSDLKFDDNFMLTGTGSLVLGSKNLTLGAQDTTWTSSIVVSGSGAQVSLRSLLTLTTTVTFNGTCTVNGNGNELHLSSKGNIVVGKNSTLVLKNVTLSGVSGNNIRCFDNSGKVIIQGADWLQDANYSFTVGSLEIKNESHFSAALQPFIFVYQTNQTMVIDHRSSMVFDQNFTFSYDPINENMTGISFVDQTATLAFNGANFYITDGGLQLTTGNLTISNASTLSVEGNVGLIIGNNTTSAGDCTVNLLAGGILDVLTGSFVYQNIDPSSWMAVNIYSTLRMEAGTTLQLNQPLNLGNGSLLLSIHSNLIQAMPSSITGTLEFFA